MSSSMYLNTINNGHLLPLSERTSEPATPETSNSNSLAISMNKGGKLYSLNEMFGVWENNKAAIMSAKLNTQGQSYKVAEPTQIHHLDLNQNPDLQTLSLEDRPITTNGSSESKKATNGDAHLPDRELISNATSNNDSSTPSLSQQQSNDHQSVLPALVAPQEIKWYYLDPAGNEQGPFNGELMQGWFNDGYLALNLMIRRLDDSTYIPLKQFCESISDFVQPFKVPLPALNTRLQQTQSPLQIAPLQTQLPMQNSSIPVQSYHPLLNTSVNFGNQPLFTDSPLSTLTSFGQSNYQTFPNSIPSLLQQQIHQQHQPVLSRTNSNWGLENYSNPGTPLSAHSGINPISKPLKPAVQPAPISPWATAVHSQSRVSSPFVPPVENNNDTVLSEFSSSVVTGILDDDDVSSATQLRPIVQTPASPEPPKTKEEAKSQPSIEEQKENGGPRVPQPKPSIQTQRKEERKPVPSNEPKNLKTVIAKTENKSSATTLDNKAPWAAATSEPKPSLSLKEIQKLENEKLEKQKQLEQEMRLEQQQRLLQEERNRERDESRDINERFSLPSTTSWAVSFNSQPKVIKTLAEIQREEKEAAELARAQKIQYSTPTLADTLVHSGSHDESGWTTIVGKKPAPVKKQPNSTSSASSSNSTRLNPQVLRSVSAASVPVTDNSSSVREEFLVWARSQMTNLYPSVSSNDLLEMFISLPSNQDSQQLISETIYSSSTTMNGRRFAQEFLKRRQKVDQQIGQSDPVSWSSAILQSADKVAEIDQDGWSTSVKSKKKSKKY